MRLLCSLRLLAMTLKSVARHDRNFWYLNHMYYDIASKVILSRCKEPFLAYFCKLPVAKAFLIEERPQETTSLRRSDFVLKAFLTDGSECLVLVEFVSSWKPWLPLRTLECRCRHILHENLPVKSFLILFTPQARSKIAIRMKKSFITLTSSSSTKSKRKK